MRSAAAGTEAYEDVTLDESRLADALALSSEAGWNQEAGDWRLLFREATVFGRVRRGDNALVGSAAILPLGERLSWIGMVLVTGAERRRGHARHLMQRSLEHIEAGGAIAGLDATPAGIELYRTLGFEDADSLMRMGCSLPSPSGGEPAPDPIRGVGGGVRLANTDLLPSPLWGGAGGGVRQANAGDLTRICDYDAKAFGADRSSVLHELLSRRPEHAFLAESAGRLTGFVLARPGRLATQIGPLVADDGDTAEHLLRAALGSLSGPAIVDAFTHHRPMCALLARLGFTDQRPFTRMLNGPAHLPRDRTVLSAGPELG